MIATVHQRSAAPVRRCCLLIPALICFLCTLVVAAQSKPPKQAAWSVWKPVGRLPTARFRWKSVTDNNGLECLVEVTTRTAMPSTHDLVVSYNYESGDQANSRGVDVMTTSWDSFIHLDARLSAQQPIQINTSDAAQYNCLSVRRVVSMPPRPQWHEQDETSETAVFYRSGELLDNLAMKTSWRGPQSLGGGSGQNNFSFSWRRHDKLQYSYPGDSATLDDSNPQWVGTPELPSTNSSYSTAHVCQVSFQPINVAENHCAATAAPFNVTYRTWLGDTKVTPLPGLVTNLAACERSGKLTAGDFSVASYGALSGINGPRGGSLGGGFGEAPSGNFLSIGDCRSVVTIASGPSQLFECGNSQSCYFCWPVGSPNPCNQQQPGGTIAH